MVRLALTTLAFCACLCTSALAAPREEALAVAQKWAAAFVASDVEGVVALFAPDALFLGTGSQAVVTDAAGVRRYFENALRNRTERTAALIEPRVMVLSDAAVVITSLDRITQRVDANTVTSPGRVTIVVARRGDKWLIVHFHRSAVPG